MNWAWRLGMYVLTGVPAIVGGGLCWQFTENWTAVIIWEVVLLFLMTTIIAKGGKGESAAH